jgi:hypothetical protein
VFLTVEDETGIANVIVWPSVFERFIVGPLIGVTGPLQNEHGVIYPGDIHAAHAALLARPLLQLTALRETARLYLRHSLVSSPL